MVPRLRLLAHVTPSDVALLLLLIGFVFVVASLSIDVFLFKVCWGSGDSPLLIDCSGAAPPHASVLRKEVGFGAALNWSLNLVILFPAFAYLAFDAYLSVPKVATRLVEDGMLVTSDFRPAKLDALSTIWRGRSFVALALSIAMAIVLTFVLYDDHGDVVAEYYTAPEKVKSITLDDPKAEVDWSIAGAVCQAFPQATPSSQAETSSQAESCPVPFEGNKVFARLVYVYGAWFVSIFVVGFFILVATLSMVLHQRYLKRHGLLLVPDLQAADDKRLGFDNFERPVQRILEATFVAYSIGFLVSLQNVYLRSSDENILKMVLPFVEQAIETGGESWYSFLEVIWSFNLQTTIITLAGVFVILMILVLIRASLRNAAIDGAAELKEWLESASPEERDRVLRGMPIGEAQQRLEQMDYWPLGWITVNKLIAWLVLATLCLFFWPLGIYVITTGLIYVLAVTVGADKAVKSAAKLMPGRDIVDLAATRIRRWLAGR